MYCTSFEVKPDMDPCPPKGGSAQSGPVRPDENDAMSIAAAIACSMVNGGYEFATLCCCPEEFADRVSSISLRIASGIVSGTKGVK